MPGEWFFLTFGGLGISIAGFSSLIFALDRRTDFNDPIVRWRIRNIASTGLAIAQTGLLVFPAYYLTDSVDTTVRIIAAVALGMTLLLGRGELKKGPAWPDERRRKITTAIAVGTAGLWILDIVIASVGLLMLLFVIWLSGAIGTFMNVILELKSDQPVREDS